MSGNQLGDHEEVEVGGSLDEARLVAIVRRGADLRNWCMSEDEARRVLQGEDPDRVIGETPSIVYCDGDGGETRYPSLELHVGCGEICPVMAELPWDGDVGGLHHQCARAIAHAGADLLDLAREVARLRRELAEVPRG